VHRETKKKRGISRARFHLQLGEEQGPGQDDEAAAVFVKEQGVHRGTEALHFGGVAQVVREKDPPVFGPEEKRRRKR
jgi:hypothetical protein